LVNNRDRRQHETEEKTRKARMRRFFTFFSGKDDTVRAEEHIPPQQGA
jgi:hypothetical protein